jgi:hypothetical protein
LQRKVPGIPNFEEILTDRDREEASLLRANSATSGDVWDTEHRDAICGANSLETISEEGEEEIHRTRPRTH